MAKSPETEVVISDTDRAILYVSLGRVQCHGFVTVWAKSAKKRIRLSLITALMFVSEQRAARMLFFSKYILLACADFHTSLPGVGLLIHAPLRSMPKISVDAVDSSGNVLRI
ncbi:hypothetical protein R5R73_17150 [Salinicola sp. LHM]|uniref:hypothetical protein n=1 Tax=Salinicola sp. LHM TaxID=3065298 RepID=UPI000DA114DF|nr:hypothetical protein [Salinicola sp. LHM]WQH32724.1 hypothetical protein R5R73_17150 [Salinicola sp. LHM]